MHFSYFGEGFWERSNPCRQRCRQNQSTISHGRKNESSTFSACIARDQRRLGDQFSHAGQRDVGFLVSFSTFGTFAGQTPPAGEALDANGNLYVADGLTAAFRNSAPRERSFSRRPPGDHHRGSSAGRRISPGGLIYVAKTGATNVEVFNSDASPNRQLAGGGTLAGEVSKPDDVKISSRAQFTLPMPTTIACRFSIRRECRRRSSARKARWQSDQPLSLAISPAASSFGDLFVVDNDSSPSVTTNRRVEIF